MYSTSTDVQHAGILHSLGMGQKRLSFAEVAVSLYGISHLAHRDANPYACTDSMP